MKMRTFGPALPPEECILGKYTQGTKTESHKRTKSLWRRRFILFVTAQKRMSATKGTVTLLFIYLMSCHYKERGRYKRTYTEKISIVN